MAKITKPDAIPASSENELEAGIEKFIANAQRDSDEVLKNIVLVAAGLIDNEGSIGDEAVGRIQIGLSKLEKNLNSSLDVLRGVNLFLEVSGDLELTEGA